MWVFPDHRATHAQTDAECCEAVADVGVLPKGARQVDHQSNAGAGERMAERDRSTVRVESRIIRGQAEMITERQHLDSECARARSSAIVAARRNFGSMCASALAIGWTIFFG